MPWVGFLQKETEKKKEKRKRNPETHLLTKLLPVAGAA
jgi:hypothetical protein